MGHGVGQPPPSGAPRQPGGSGGKNQESDQPPPIPLAPDGPGRTYGTAAGAPYGGGPPYGGQSGNAGGEAPHAYGGTPSGYPAPPGHPTAGAYGGGTGYGAQGGYGGHGAAAYAPYGYGWQGPPLPAGKSIAAMVVGIVSAVLIITCWGSFLSVISSTVALLLGFSARRAVRRGELGGRAQATAGFVLGIVSLALSVIVSVLLVLSLTVWADETGGGDSGPGGSGDSYDARGAGAAPVALSLGG
ncbi:DUF4190 domain-containing protein [Streptomyces tubbatahanensis]|uniref:DUF4190 domain-containing protein n=1 Tax=Streptomyces tubbatahanensis TaxID=2923272 RepID=A0ABY3XY34_9ACTN|nr:DUF4190 domain-containing protein [Streptomyces tubbatahanensis]UNS99290.1 DUF4190 domain-containing protein [Streptomyces tubbatahanensis]